MHVDVKATTTPGCHSWCSTFGTVATFFDSQFCDCPTSILTNSALVGNQYLLRPCPHSALIAGCSHALTSVVRSQVVATRETLPASLHTCRPNLPRVLLYICLLSYAKRACRFWWLASFDSVVACMQPAVLPKQRPLLHDFPEGAPILTARGNCASLPPICLNGMREWFTTHQKHISNNLQWQTESMS